MSDNYRSKLIDWLTSMLLLLTIAVMGACIRWFEILSIVRLPIETESFLLNLAAGPIGEALMIFPDLFPAVLCWHLSDFLESTRPKRPILRVLTQNGFLVGIFSLLLSMVSTHWLFVSPYDGGWCTGWLRNCGIFSYPSTATLPNLLWSMMVLILWLVSLLKLAVVIVYRLRAVR